MKTYLEFGSCKEALLYRREKGTGGWVFAVADNGPAFIFPFGMTPSQVMIHPLVAGYSGALL